MAVDVHLSQSYAYRIFHQETGSSITEHVKARRLKQDYLLLKTTTLLCGIYWKMIRFPNGAYFIQLLRKSAGTNPLHYRNNLNEAVSINLVCKKVALLRLYIHN